MSIKISTSDRVISMGMESNSDLLLQITKNHRRTKQLNKEIEIEQLFSVENERYKLCRKKFKN